MLSHAGIDTYYKGSKTFSCNKAVFGSLVKKKCKLSLIGLKMVEDCMALVHLNSCGFMANKKVRQCSASFIDLVQRTTLPKWLIDIFKDKSAIQINYA